jgi:hypothetical protein
MKAADRASRRPAAADRNAEALLRRRGAGACTRQIDLFCAPQLMSTEVPRSAQIEDLFVVVVVKWLAGFSSPAARMAVWPA